MSDTVKLIIEIPESIFDTIQADEMISREQLAILQMYILNGIPLANDSERAEVQAYFEGQTYGWEQGRKALIDELKTEIRAEQEKYSHPLEIERAIEILDNIGKESEGTND